MAKEVTTTVARRDLEGRLKYRVDVVDGIEHAPETLNRVFDGGDTAELLVKVT